MNPERTFEVVVRLTSQKAIPQWASIQRDAEMALELVDELQEEIYCLEQLLAGVVGKDAADVLMELKIKDARWQRAATKALDAVETALDQVADAIEETGHRA